MNRKDLAAPPSSFLNDQPNRVKVHTNVNARYTATKIPLSRSINSIEIGKNNIPLPPTVKIKGKKTPFHFPELSPAAPAQMKDQAISDIRCLDIDQGMKSGLVTCTLEDRSGYLWIGTDGGGLSRYDGNSFVHFTTEEGMINNTVNAILEDPNGHIWLGTGGGLSRFDGNSFIHFTVEDGLKHNYVKYLIQDSRGQLWFSTSGGLSRLVPESSENNETFNGILTNYTTEEGLAHRSIGPLAEDHQGNIWFGTYDQGVHLFRPNKNNTGGHLWQLSTQNGLSGNKVRSLLVDIQGQVWIGTFNNGVNIYPTKNEKEPSQFLHFSSQNGLSHRSVISLMEDSHHNVWIGTGGGVNKYGPHQDGTASFTFYNTDQGLSHTNVYSMYEDSQGNLWWGTHNGLCIHDPLQDKTGGGSHFNHFSKKEGLLSEKVISILEDHQGNMWFGTMGGLHKYNGQTMAQYNIEDGLSSRSVRAMMEDRKGQLWFGTERGGLNRYAPEPEGKAGKISQYGIAQGLTDIHITAMLEDSRGNYWFGTLRDGVNHFKPDPTGAGGSFTQYRTSEGLSSNEIRFILEDKQGNIWFGTKGGGVSYFTPEKKDTEGKFYHFTTDEGLSHHSVNTIMQDSQGKLWFGTWGGGVTRYDPITHQINYFTTKDGLSSNIIWTMLEDREKRIWMATENGISLLVPDPASFDTFQIFTFGKPDGLKKTVFEGNSVYLNSKNQLWWGGGFNGGLTMLDLNHFKLPKRTPKVQLMDVQLNQRRIDFRNLKEIKETDRPFGKSLLTAFESVAGFYNYPTSLDLPNHLNHLTFQFSAIDWQAPHKIKYSYRMKGLEEEWSPPHSANKADYRNLPYGDFSFQVRAVGNSQVWSAPFSYAFSIRPAWWQTWWARLMYLGAVIGLLYNFIQWRLNKLRKERNEKKAFAEALIYAQETEKKRIARDLHDGIGQSLLLIRKQLENTTRVTNENKKLIENTLEEVRSISRDLHPFQLEKFGLTAAIQDSLKKVEVSTDLFITHEIQNIDNLLSAKAEINVYRTIQEAMSNIVKHAEASAAKLSINSSGKGITIYIQDNGKGFDHGHAIANSKSLGLKTMYERISSIGGHLSIRKGTPKGTVLQIDIPNSPDNRKN